jgi:methionyl-tRNA formyltransferase
MSTPSEKAARLAAKIAKIYPRVERAGSAGLLNTALNEARLEGARAMQKAAADFLQRPMTKEEWDLNWTNEQHIRALDPQQVANESKDND